MEKILIPGAGEFQIGLIQAAMDRGIYTIVVSPDGDYPGLQLADKVYYHDATDKEFLLEIARQEQVGGIISDQGEIFVKPVAYVAEHLGLPGNPYEVADLYTNKGLMRKRGQELGLPTIESYTVGKLEDALEIFRKINSTVIIKPSDSFSSKGVALVESEEDLRNKFEHAQSFSTTGTVIVERFIRGRVLEVDSVILKGKVETLMHGETWDFDVPDVFSSRLRLYPINLSDELIAKLLDYNRKINEGFGAVQGITHNEYMLEDGTNEIYLVEAALRGGGAFVGSTITSLQTDFDASGFLIDAAMGRLAEIPKFRTQQCHCGFVAFYIPIGEVLEIHGLDEVEQLEYVEKTTFEKLYEGYESTVLEGKDQRHLVVLKASSRQELLERIEKIKSLIDIKVRTDKGVAGPIWE